MESMCDLALPDAEDEADDVTKEKEKQQEAEENAKL